MFFSKIINFFRKKKKTKREEIDDVETASINSVNSNVGSSELEEWKETQKEARRILLDLLDSLASYSTRRKRKVTSVVATTLKSSANSNEFASFEKWNEFPNELKLKCIDEMDLMTRARLRRTCHTEKALVGALPLDIQLIKIAPSNDGRTPELTIKRNDDDLCIFQVPSPRLPDFLELMRRILTEGSVNQLHVHGDYDIALDVEFEGGDTSSVFDEFTSQVVSCLRSTKPCRVKEVHTDDFGYKGMFSFLEDCSGDILKSVVLPHRFRSDHNLIPVLMLRAVSAASSWKISYVDGLTIATKLDYYLKHRALDFDRYEHFKTSVSNSFASLPHDKEIIMTVDNITGRAVINTDEEGGGFDFMIEMIGAYATYRSRYWAEMARNRENSDEPNNQLLRIILY